MSKAQKFRDQSTEELQSLVRDLRKEKFEMVNNQQQTKKLEKPHRLWEIKRDLARAYTVLNERERAAKAKGVEA